jgi:nucleoside-diphosphate-sugar epimerase
MKVFVAGATGAIGRRLVPQLAEAGHEVTAMTRSQERGAPVRAAGAETVVCDVFDAAGVERAITEAAPEAVIHQLTALPARFNPRDKSIYDPTNRVRSEGTRNLLAGARAAGARRFVCQSIAFAYRPEGSPVKDEDAPLLTDGAPPFGDAVRTVAEMERAVVEAPDMEGLVLRYGWFYGPGTYFAEDGSMTADLRKRRYPIVGPGTGLFSLIHVDDAAAATVLALERGEPGIYNIVDNEPAPMREMLPALAEAVGAPRPRRVPVWLARIAAGKMVAQMGVELRGASNAKARRELGFEPRWRTWREGFAEAPR